MVVVAVVVEEEVVDAVVEEVVVWWWRRRRRWWWRRRWHLLVQQVAQRTRHNALLPGRHVAERVRLARARLPIAHDATVESLSDALEHARLEARRVEDLLLRRRRWQRRVKHELPRALLVAARAGHATAAAAAVGVLAALHQPQTAALAQQVARPLLSVAHLWPDPHGHAHS